MSNTSDLSRRVTQHMAHGQFKEARDLLAEHCEKYQHDGQAWFLLADANGHLGVFSETERCARQSILIRPDNAMSHYLLGKALQAQQKYAESVGAFQQALRLNPGQPEAYYSLGESYYGLGKLADAESCYRQSIAAQPQSPQAYSSLAFVYRLTGKLDLAEQIYRRLIEMSPQYLDARNGLASVLQGQCRIAEAVQMYRDLVRTQPQYMAAQSNLALCVNYSATMSPSAVAREIMQIGTALTAGAEQFKSHGNTPIPDRQLRVGYVSGDLKLHSVTYFFEPLLENHDARKVLSYCYSGTSAADQVTDRLKSMAGRWRNTHGMSDKALIELIREDRIDILVDLSGHTAGHRLKVFAGRPAPIEITYLGFPNTTGLEAIDYRITDAWADPPQCDEGLYTETPMRLARGFLAYKAAPVAPDVAPLPAQATGYVTFGSFNNLAKMNPSVIAIWAKLLKAVPGSRIVLKNKPLGQEAIASRMVEMFSGFGISREQVILMGSRPLLVDHLATYGQIDIALDTFPYNGTTTTCEALWAGVPVITLAGDRHAGRVGASLLTQVGKEEWIATSFDEYVALAVQLSSDLDRLAHERGTLREVMADSLLCDAKAIAEDMERIYSEAWLDWCSRQ